jgi:hypothetical protein
LICRRRETPNGEAVCSALDTKAVNHNPVLARIENSFNHSLPLAGPTVITRRDLQANRVVDASKDVHPRVERRAARVKHVRPSACRCAESPPVFWRRVSTSNARCRVDSGRAVAVPRLSARHVSNGREGALCHERVDPRLCVVSVHHDPVVPCCQSHVNHSTHAARPTIVACRHCNVHACVARRAHALV